MHWRPAIVLMFLLGTSATLARSKGGYKSFLTK
jgi:hypothetical protein